LVATTTYVVRDKYAHFLDLAKQVQVEIYSAPLDFSQSPYSGLADYEKGYVKEGVGAGGAVWYAEQLGVSPDRVVRKTEQLYQAMIKKS
jgi:NaMN:DMB phosphoribosyltransferase